MMRGEFEKRGCHVCLEFAAAQWIALPAIGFPLIFLLFQQIFQPFSNCQANATEGESNNFESASLKL